MCQSGGCIDVLAEPGLANPEKQVIAGNGCGYGASGGRPNYQGGLGDRAFVRNSDTVAVIGSAANFLAEYATRGMVVVLDENGVGKFAGAGAAAGLIIQYDPQGKLPRKADGKSVNVYRLTDY